MKPKLNHYKLRKVSPQLLHGWTALANMLGVSVGTAKKYAEMYDIPIIKLSKKQIRFYSYDVILALRQNAK